MNHLIHETSPYLLQHAHNPVDWYAWTPEALNRAKAENKLILVSIGYSTCHWCHVMERESFEHDDTAAIMNEHFICIKVDREERPDIDAIYMEACQMMTGGGGWPLNCFLLPDGRPFYAGTYFPPRPAHNRPSWVHVLQHLARAWREQPEEVIAQAGKITAQIQKSDQPPITTASPNTETSPLRRVGEAYLALSERFEKIEGGFGSAPKFPGTMSICFLLQFYYFSRHREALDHALLSLDKMSMGGIYDHLGGGFSRYATDNEWLIPHFEKMLYDNALLVSTLSDAYKLLGDKTLLTDEYATRRALYRETIVDTLGWVKREMTHAQGGFYSAQDADSEGIEGKFFVWNLEEVTQVLQKAGFDATFINQFCAFYDITERGNWEEQNILHRNIGYAAFAQKYRIDPTEFTQKTKKARQILFETRDRRIYPGLDDKILLGWNALMVSAYTDAYTALGDVEYLRQATQSTDFLLRAFFPAFPESGWPAGGLHTWKNGEGRIMAFLEDYAYLIAALLDLYEANGEEKYLQYALQLAEYAVEHFYDTTDGLFFFTNAQQNDIILRKKEMYDNATPSANSTMALNLQRLSIYYDRDDWRIMAATMIDTLAPSVLQFPNAFARWAEALSAQDLGLREIAVAGPDARKVSASLQTHFLPLSVIATDDKGDNNMPLVQGKFIGGDTFIYICRNFACQRPVEAVVEALDILRDNR